MRWADDVPSEERATLARFNGESDDGPVKVQAHRGRLSRGGIKALLEHSRHGTLHIA